MAYNRRSPTQSPPTLDGDNTCPRCHKCRPILKVKGKGKKHPVGTPYLACFRCHWWYFFPTLSGANNSSPTSHAAVTCNRTGIEATDPNSSRNYTILVDARNSSFNNVGAQQHNHSNIADSPSASSNGGHDREETPARELHRFSPLLDGGMMLVKSAISFIVTRISALWHLAGRHP